MANTTPQPPSTADVQMSAAEFVTKWDGKFADNTIQNINEAMLREFKNDMVVVFTNWKELTVKRVKGSPYPVPNTSALGTIPALYLVQGMTAVALNGTDATTAGAGVLAPPVTFQLIRDSQGLVSALTDVEPTTTSRVPAKWVQISGPKEQQQASFDELIPEDHNYKAGDVFKYTFPGGVVRLLEWRADSASFVHPVPTGLDTDYFYAPFAPVSVLEHEQNTDTGSTAGEFRLRLNSGFQDHGTGATTLVFEGVQGGNQAALRFKFQNDDDTETAIFEQCLEYTGSGTDVWAALAAGAQLDALAAQLATQTSRLDALLAGSTADVDTFLEVLNRFVTDESASSALTSLVATKAPLASAALTGTPTAPTPAAGTNSTRLATTAFVQAVAGLLLSKANNLSDLQDKASAIAN
ncbi:hypothetical protein, partial [Hymenobacter terricola]|uniref:hypothetical protein n=1 Tax=Hymenobacter terricola TaxID=2819236 RepID=UPI001CF4334E